MKKRKVKIAAVIKRKAKFVVLEGIDGCGKSLQIRSLKKNLPAEHFVFTKEHTSGVVGRLIEKVLYRQLNLNQLSLQLLFVADRLDHLEKVIKPALEKGKIVISDRYFWATVAYGSLVVDKNWLLKINEVCLVPDLIILIDLEPKIALARITKARERKTIFEKEEKLKKVRETYLELAKKFKASTVVINGDRKPEEISKEIKKAILSC